MLLRFPNLHVNHYGFWTQPTGQVSFISVVTNINRSKAKSSHASKGLEAKQHFWAPVPFMRLKSKVQWMSHCQSHARNFTINFKLTGRDHSALLYYCKRWQWRQWWWRLCLYRNISKKFWAVLWGTTATELCGAGWSVPWSNEDLNWILQEAWMPELFLMNSGEMCLYHPWLPNITPTSICGVASTIFHSVFPPRIHPHLQESRFLNV